MQILRITHGAVVLANDPNGCQVMQYCIKNFNPQYTVDILMAVAQNCFEVATNKSGCIVLQDCIEHSFGHITEHLVNGIVSYATSLAENAYGHDMTSFFFFSLLSLSRLI